MTLGGGFSLAPVTTPRGMSRFVGPVALFWVAAYLYIGLATIPTSVAPRRPWDLVLHAGTTGLLAALLFEWSRSRIESSTAARFAVVAASILGFVVEVGQAIVPHRGFDLADLAADVIGALGAVWLHPRLAARISAPRLAAAIVVAGAVASVLALALTGLG